MADDHTSRLGGADDDDDDEAVFKGEPGVLEDEPVPLDDIDDDLMLEEEAERAAAKPAPTPPPTPKPKPAAPAKAKRPRKATTTGAKRESPLARVRGKATVGVKKATGFETDVTNDAKRAIPEGAKSPKEVRTLQILLVSVSCLAALFLVLAIIGFTSGDGAEAEPAPAPAADPAVVEPAPAPAPAPAATQVPDPKVLEDLEATKSVVSTLRRNLADAEREAAELTSQVSTLTQEKERLLRRAQQSAPRDADAHERAIVLERELKRAKMALADAEMKIVFLERGSARLVADAAALRDAARKAEKEAADARGRFAELETEVADLNEELAAVDELLPNEPLAPGEAARKYKETVEAVQEETNRAERVALYRDLEFTLAGTRYGPAAARLRRNEQKLLERDAAVAVKEVSRAIKKTPDARESNLAALNEALSKVKGLPAYEKRIRALIDEQQ